MTKLIDQRLKLSVFQIADQIKQRVSFFGIYSCHDKVRESQDELEHFKQQLRDSIKEIYDRQEALEKKGGTPMVDGIPSENPHDNIRRKVTKMSNQTSGLVHMNSMSEAQKLAPAITKTLQSKRTSSAGASKDIEFQAPEAQELESGDESETIGPSIFRFFKKKKTMNK